MRHSGGHGGDFVGTGRPPLSAPAPADGLAPRHAPDAGAPSPVTVIGPTDTPAVDRHDLTGRQRTGALHPSQTAFFQSSWPIACHAAPRGTRAVPRGTPKPVSPLVDALTRVRRTLWIGLLLCARWLSLTDNPHTPRPPPQSLRDALGHAVRFCTKSS